MQEKLLRKQAKTEEGNPARFIPRLEFEAVGSPACCSEQSRTADRRRDSDEVGGRIRLNASGADFPAGRELWQTFSLPVQGRLGPSLSFPAGTDSGVTDTSEDRGQLP